MTLTQRILVSTTIVACLIAVSGISAAQEVSPPAQANNLEQQVKIITKILDELEKSDQSPDDKNKKIKLALDSLMNVGESHEIFKRAIQSTIPLGLEIVNNLMRSENNKEKENQRLVATRQAAALMLILTLAHLADIDSSFTKIDTKIDSSLVKVQANSDTIKKHEERLDSLKQIQIFNTTLTIHQQTFVFSVALTFSFSLVAFFPISEDPLWLWCIKKVVEYIQKR